MSIILVDINQNKQSVNVTNSLVLTELYKQFGENHEVTFDYELKVWFCIESAEFDQYNLHTLINAANCANYLQHQNYEKLCDFITPILANCENEELANILKCKYNPNVDIELLMKYDESDLNKLK